MINTLRAYLQTEGNVDYRECKIAYYTYSMFETPNKYKINVNVHIQSPKNQSKKTLNIDNSFDNESEAINYGIDQAKKFIDLNYESGKISFISTESEKDRKERKPFFTQSSKVENGQSKDQK